MNEKKKTLLNEKENTNYPSQYYKECNLAQLFSKIFFNFRSSKTYHNNLEVSSLKFMTFLSELVKRIIVIVIKVNRTFVSYSAVFTWRIITQRIGGR